MRFIAKFEPQRWDGDQAVPVDPIGVNVWDCTETMEAVFKRAQDAQPADDNHWSKFYTREYVLNEIRQIGQFLDRHDILHTGLITPAWIRGWRGPFTITVTLDSAIREFAEHVAYTLSRAYRPPDGGYAQGLDVNEVVLTHTGPEQSSMILTIAGEEFQVWVTRPPN